MPSPQPYNAKLQLRAFRVKLRAFQAKLRAFRAKLRAIWCQPPSLSSPCNTKLRVLDPDP